MRSRTLKRRLEGWGRKVSTASFAVYCSRFVGQKQTFAYFSETRMSFHPWLTNRINIGSNRMNAECLFYGGRAVLMNRVIFIIRLRKMMMTIGWRRKSRWRWRVSVFLVLGDFVMRNLTSRWRISILFVICYFVFRIMSLSRKTIHGSVLLLFWSVSPLRSVPRTGSCGFLSMIFFSDMNVRSPVRQRGFVWRRCWYRYRNYWCRTNRNCTTRILWRSLPVAVLIAYGVNVNRTSFFTLTNTSLTASTSISTTVKEYFANFKSFVTMKTLVDFVTMIWKMTLRSWSRWRSHFLLVFGHCIQKE